MSDLEQDFLRAREQQPVARTPSTFGEVWSANWDATGLEALTGVGKPAEDAYQDLVKAVEGRIGRPVHEALRERGVGLGTASTREQRVGMIGTLVADLPEDQRKLIEPLMDVRKRAATKAADIEREAADVNDNAYGVSANVVRFAAGVARQAVDPVNVLTMPLGGPLKGPVLPMLGREFAFGAAAQALQTPRIQSGREELGLESGFARGAGDVFEAGLGNAGFAGLLRGGAAVLRAVRGSARGRPEAPGVRADDGGPAVETAPADSPAGPAGQSVELRPEVARNLQDVAPEDLEAVAHVVERDTALDAQAPNATAVDHVRIADGVDEAKIAIEAGRPFDPEKAALADTRGLGRQFHGSSAVELAPSSEHYSTKSYYGQGFYTTDAVDIAFGYSKRGATNTGERNVFTVEENRPLKIYDAEQPIDADLLAKIAPDPKSTSALDDVVDLALSEKPKNLRELYDEIRDIGTAEGHSADTIQEIFDAINYNLRGAGFDGMSHTGGLRTSKPAHKVVIYFDPETALTVRKDNFNNFREPPPSPALSELPLPPSVKSEVPAKPKADGASAPKDADAKPPAAGGDEPAAPKPIGDPALARDADRVLEEIGDFEVVLKNPDGSFRKVAARDALREVDDDASAARELADCIGTGVAA